MDKIYYRSLHRYKYQLMKHYVIDIGINSFDINISFVRLRKNGLLTIKKGYCWDGPSGPTFDTATFMRGSLIHDVLYQLIRLGWLSTGDRLFADKLLKKICHEDGMSKFRAWYVYKAVRWFGKSSAKINTQNQNHILQAPL